MTPILPRFTPHQGLPDQVERIINTPTTPSVDQHTPGWESPGWLRGIPLFPPDGLSGAIPGTRPDLLAEEGAFD